MCPVHRRRRWSRTVAIFIWWADCERHWKKMHRGWHRERGDSESLRCEQPQSMGGSGQRCRIDSTAQIHLLCMCLIRAVALEWRGTQLLEHERFGGWHQCRIEVGYLSQQLCRYWCTWCEHGCGWKFQYILGARKFNKLGPHFV
jgi:hypothetical protein